MLNCIDAQIGIFPPTLDCPPCSFVIAELVVFIVIAGDFLRRYNKDNAIRDSLSPRVAMDENTRRLLLGLGISFIALFIR